MHAQTPLSCGPARTWASELAAYMEAAASREGRCKARARREALAAAVHAAPESPDAWWALLSGEEAAGAALTGASPVLHAVTAPKAEGGLVGAAERRGGRRRRTHRCTPYAARAGAT